MKPDPAIVLDLIEAFRRSKTMFVATSLGVFDMLAQGPASAGELAARLKADLSALTRLLDGCAGLGLLDKHEGRYANTPVAHTYLLRHSPDTLAGYILYSNAALYPMWGHLEEAVKEGTNRWSQTFGGDKPVFEHFFRTDEAMQEFLLGMHGFGQLCSPSVVSAFDLSRFKRLVDLGGGTGHLALAAAARYSHLRTAVFDLPRVIGYARRFVDDRVELIEGDFFADELPGADLYALGRIVHDWSEPKIRLLLAKIYAALPAGGALLIGEKLVNPGHDGPVPALMQSLNMLVCTEGRERSLDEYRALLEEAGFARVEGKLTGTPLDAVLATKA
ncbi:MAG: class I SAM-dependent methyltransferase [Bryobacteraceae bacterium]|nr:class I SAM-dependent methyltransferase [Bryobacteraceae bacterium]